MMCRTQLLPLLQQLDPSVSTFFIQFSFFTGSCFIVEMAMETSGSQTTLGMKGKNLTTMCRTQLLPLLQELDLSVTMFSSIFIFTGSRFIVETAMETSGSQTTLSLKGQSLTTMCRTQLLPLLQELDLSDNSLRQLRDFAFLQRLRCLNLAANKLKSCRGLGRLPCLTSLDLSHNRILWELTYMLVGGCVSVCVPRKRFLASKCKF